MKNFDVHLSIYPCIIVIVINVLFSRTVKFKYIVTIPQFFPVQVVDYIFHPFVKLSSEPEGDY